MTTIQILLLIYLVVTTIIATWWQIKNPSVWEDEDANLFEIVVKLGLSAIFAWCFVPIFLMLSIKIKRPKQYYNETYGKSNT
jgi:hypothetical protein